MNQRTVALELAYQYRMGKLESIMDPSMNRENEARGWAEQHYTEDRFMEDAERLLTKLESPR